MLEIQERFDTAGYEHIIAAAGINNVHITEALDGSTAIGFIAYAYAAERTVVYDFDDGGKLASLVKLHFLAEGSNVCKNIDGFLNACEHCKK